MSDTPRSGKKDQRVRREALKDIQTQTRKDSTEPKLENPNRDQARGDWDRTGRHGDEGATRFEEEE